MNKQIAKNNFISYIIILISFFILLFFTKGFYNTLQLELDTHETLQQQESEVQDELTRLNDLKAKFSQDESDVLKEIQGFTGEYSDAAISDYIYSYAQQVNLGNERIIIRDLTLSDVSESDLGFSKADINLSVVVSSQETLLSFISYLVSEDSAYRFYMTSFDYALGDTTPTINVTLPLTLYFK